MSSERTRAQIVAIGGGKGGVGKSILTIGLGTALARQGSRVILADLDLGAANLHTYLGVLGPTPTIADFILNKVPSLDSLRVETSVQNLALISGADFVPGVTSPAHWMKLKLMRHLKALPADFVIIDLGAGVHFNTLDFFGIADRGVVITAPEPGAVLNAYSFLKGALFRKMQNVFKHHPQLSGIIDAEAKSTGQEQQYGLEWIKENLQHTAPELLPLVDEIEQQFTPALVINRAPQGQTHLLVKNLISLAREKLGVRLNHVGDLPEAREISNHLLNVPRFFSQPSGSAYYQAVQDIVRRMEPGERANIRERAAGYDFSDEERDEILGVIETLDERVFTSATKNTWKLRMFFKPGDVIEYLISRGITHPLFYKSAS